MFQYIPEELSARLIDHDLATRAVSDAFVAAIDPEGKAFPVVVGHVANGRNRFTIKSGAAATFWGLKVGSYWPGNDLRGVPRHNSCIFLFDHETGQLRAAIEARKANAYRTAAANALAVDHLARRDATRLAIFGAGHQAAFECRAVMRVRKIEEIHVVNRSAERSHLFAESLAGEGVRVKVSTADVACRHADIIVTATGSTAPLLTANSVGPGTHISSMGSDAVGKQELPVDLLQDSQLFCDYLEQSLVIGEFQRIAAAVRDGAITAPTNLGEVLTGRHSGRASERSITIFDSSGIALQDLYLGAYLLERAGLTPR